MYVTDIWSQIDGKNNQTFMYMHDARDYSVVRGVHISNIQQDLSDDRDKTWSDQHIYVQYDDNMQAGLVD